MDPTAGVVLRIVDLGCRDVFSYVAYAPPQGETLAAGCNDGSVRIVDPKAGVVLRTVDLGGVVFDVYISYIYIYIYIIIFLLICKKGIYTIYTLGTAKEDTKATEDARQKNTSAFVT